MSGKNIHQRLHSVMSAVGYIQKEKKQGMRYSIVSHDAVTAKVRPALVQEGIVYYPVALQYLQDGNRTQVALSVRFANIDDPTDYIDVPSLGFGIDDQDKGAGKAISYAVKYALLKTLGLESGDDPDQDQDVQHRPADTPTRPASAPQARSSTARAPVSKTGDAGSTPAASATPQQPRFNTEGLLVVPMTADDQPDWREWGRLFVEYLETIDDLGALNKVVELHRQTLNNMGHAWPKGREALGTRIDNRRGLLAQAPTKEKAA